MSLIIEKEDLINHLIYGDIDEMSLSILGHGHDNIDGLDEEQITRLQAAATVKAFFEGKLHKGGYLV